MKPQVFALAAAFVVLIPGTIYAANHKVEMKASDGRSMSFEPRLPHVQPGDTVTFIVKDKGHNSATAMNAIPDGAATWNGKMNEEITVKVLACTSINALLMWAWG